jgi:hypothetical protein
LDKQLGKAFEGVEETPTYYAINEDDNIRTHRETAAFVDKGSN